MDNLISHSLSLAGHSLQEDQEDKKKRDLVCDDFPYWSVTHFLHGQPVTKSKRRGNKFDDLTRWSGTHFFHGQPVNKFKRRGNKIWRPYSLILLILILWLYRPISTPCRPLPWIGGRQERDWGGSRPFNWVRLERLGCKYNRRSE